MKKLSVLSCVFAVILIVILAGCGTTPTHGRIQQPLESVLAQARETVTEISPELALQEIESNSELLILDVRTKMEYDKVHIKGCVLIPRGFLEFKIKKNDMFPDINKRKIPSKDQPVLTYCKSGGRGLLAAKLLKEMGYTNMRNIKGGIQAWMKSNLPLEKDQELGKNQ